jgi:hypothetical protein
LSEVLLSIEGSSITLAVNHPIMASSAMGIDIIGKLTPVQGNYTFIIVAVEYFMTLVEVKPITNVSTATIKNFF